MNAIKNRIQQLKNLDNLTSGEYGEQIRGFKEGVTLTLKEVNEIINERDWVFRDKNRNIKITTSIRLLKQRLKEIK